LIVIGTPSSALNGVPPCHCAADACACASAPSASMMYMALILDSHSAIRASAARVASTGDSRRARSPCDNSCADSLWRAVMGCAERQREGGRAPKATLSYLIDVVPDPLAQRRNIYLLHAASAGEIERVRGGRPHRDAGAHHPHARQRRGIGIDTTANGDEI